MECNRDEAVRAREIAEKKFLAKDIAGAKKFALKAQNLYPSLDGVSQMVATLNVIIAAEEIVNGERDWYGVLRASPSADEATVKKQYRKLALMLHPDKNKSVGAEGAFKFISEAWSVLSDKSKRMAYDQKRNLKTKLQRHPQPQSSSNGFYNFAKTAASNVRSQKCSGHARTVPPTPTPTHSSNPNTFWTSCSHCKMQYEYILVYLNRNLLCPNCHEPFLAVEKENPTNGTHPPSSKSSKQQQTLHQTFHSYKFGPNASKIPGKGATTASLHNVDGFNSSDLRWGAFSRTAGAASASASSTAAAQAANMVHQAYQKVRREREEKQAAARREEQRKVQFSKRNAHAKTTGNSNATIASETMLSRKHFLIFKEDRPEKKRRSITEDCLKGHVGNASEKKTAVSDVQRKFSSTSAFEMERSNLIFGYPGKSAALHRQSRTLFREPSYLDIQNMLLEKAKLLFWRKLDSWAHAEAVRMGGKENVKPTKNTRNGAKEKEMTSRNGVTPDDKKVGESHIPKVPEGDVSSNNSEEVPDESYSIDVPDPDFHDFDKDRSEKCFEADQVWSSYDDEDGMPRFYVLIRKILSLKPFKIRISFLNSKSNTEFSQLNWVARGFPKSCGEFRVGNCKTKDSINIFSHRVNCEKSQQGIMRIIPRKGEVWALYRNWSPHWDEHTPDDVVHKYDMVEVIDGYTEEQGVSVIPLSKVPNFKAVFRKQLDSNNARKIPREEMFRFSHQVPSHLLTGKEAQGSPKGCYELDPAATPLELLQVTTEPKE